MEIAFIEKKRFLHFSLYDILLNILYIYIYIYVCVCVCVFSRKSNNIRPSYFMMYKLFITYTGDMLILLKTLIN